MKQSFSMAVDKSLAATQDPAESEEAGKAGEMKALVEWFCDLSPQQVFWQPLLSLKRFKEV